MSSAPRKDVMVARASVGSAARVVILIDRSEAKSGVGWAKRGIREGRNERRGRIVRNFMRNEWQIERRKAEPAKKSEPNRSTTNSHLPRLSVVERRETSIESASTR